MTHLRYSKTTWKEREKEGARGEKKKQRWKEMGVCVSVSASLSVHLFVCLLIEDGADVHVVAALATLFNVPQEEGIVPLCFKFHRPSKWAQTCFQNK